MRILVVEDLGIMRRVVVNTLKSIGFDDFVEAETGIQALEILNTDSIDLMITDWLMPQMDGLSLINIIRKSDNLKDIPVIMLTTKGGKDDVLTAYTAEINGYIVKPFTAQVLKDKIDSVISPYQTYNL